jgi:hypothetical protein
MHLLSILENQAKFWSYECHVDDFFFSCGNKIKGMKWFLTFDRLLQCHYSYSACGLGSDGTDRLVQLVQEIQHSKLSKSEGGTLYGAKITGGGSGGTVGVIGRNCLRSSQQILEVILFLFLGKKRVSFTLIHESIRRPVLFFP